ncbi:MAG: PQQ-dependent sugar dehydrogenase [Burkholderiaceae bacterium]
MRASFTLAIPCVLSAAFLAACGAGGTSPSLDSLAPTATLVSPAAFADNLTGTWTLSATASDNVGVTLVEYQVDGGPVGSTGNAPLYLQNVATGDYAAGQHVVRARARDAAGNVSPWSSATVRFSGTASVAQGFSKDEAWVAGLTAATSMAQASDGRWFVAEQGGALRVVKGANLLPTPFLQLAVNSAGERGLIGVALHPNFAINGFVYVHYTTGTAPLHNRVSRFQAVPANSDMVLPGSEVFIVDDLPELGTTNHNGGAIHFGSDGKLYVGVGDNTVGANAQDLDSPLGKLLRFNDDGTIPGDNPFFATRTGLAQAIWAYGLRNPFTFAVEPGSGRIHINDVGENSWEEINRGAAGADYGWPGSEGPTAATGVTAPLFAYPRNPTAQPGTGPGGFFTGAAIAGGTFYPATGTFPAEMRGNYFFADFVNRFVARLDPANGDAAYAFANLGANPVDVQVGIDGAVYVLTRSAITRIAAN